jgi:lysozyme
MTDILRTGAKGIALIKSFEGLELRAYKCPADVLTIGYGSTGPHVKPNMVITEKQAEDLLRQDLVRFERAVTRLVTVPISQNQYDALVSFTFNLGEGNFSRSTLLKRVNARDFSGAQREFAKWNRAGGVVLAGLTRRRAAEARLFGEA